MDLILIIIVMGIRFNVTAMNIVGEKTGNAANHPWCPTFISHPDLIRCVSDENQKSRFVCMTTGIDNKILEAYFDSWISSYNCGSGYIFNSVRKRCRMHIHEFREEIIFHSREKFLKSLLKYKKTRSGFGAHLMKFGPVFSLNVFLTGPSVVG